MTAYSNADRPIRPVAGTLTPRLIDLAERATVLGAFAYYVTVNYDPHHWLNFAIAMTDLVTVWFILFRRPTTSVSLDPQDWILAWGGTLLAMLARPGGTALVPPGVAICMVAAGGLITLAAKFSLARSFGLAPANRGVRMRGAYVFVRHPMYLGYAITHTAYLLMNPTLVNTALIGATWLFQFGRVMREERWLRQDRAYRRYSRIVRFRLIPGVF
ncbi:MAG TPA: isoprenylcysteine carboxylmethyltransferase family protein [Phenylobacterium sp.]|nr:isoprenylcysteine carboxylmethyltransferase family protein [Phenylobacterium sp.]